MIIFGEIFMREDICTIPVSEAFEEIDGCPICRMYKTVEERILTYIMGDAMMEPDVRIETNKVGFCPDHLNKMMSMRGRLQLSLMLETHLKEISDTVFSKKLFSGAEGRAKAAKKFNDNCFVCDKIGRGFDRMIDTIYRTYEKDKDFRELFNGQPQFCLHHFELLISGANKKRMPKYHKEFSDNITRITGEHCRTLCEDITAFCKMYDYRSKDAENPDSAHIKLSPERAVGFLNGQIPDEK